MNFKISIIQCLTCGYTNYLFTLCEIRKIAGNNRSIRVNFQKLLARGKMALTFMFFAVLCVLCVGMYYIVMWCMTKRRLLKMASKFKGPPTLPLIGNLHMLLGNSEQILKTLTGIFSRYPSPFRMWFGPMLAFAITNPEQAEEILLNPTTLDKGDFIRNLVGPLFGTGIVMAPVSMWRAHRKLIQPTFNKKILASQVKIFAAQAQILTEQMEVNLDGPEFEIYELLALCTLDMICESAMGVKTEAQTDRSFHFVKVLQQLGNTCRDRLFTWWLCPDFIFYQIKLWKNCRSNLNYMHDFAENVIRRKKSEILKRNSCSQPAIDDEEDAHNSSSERGASLDYLLKLTDDTGKLSNEELRDEVLTLIAAGNESTAIAMSFMMLMLASHPDVQDKVYQEIYKIYGNADNKERPVTPEDLTHMKYLERVIKETLRLFPVVPFITRGAIEDLNLGGITLPKDSYIVIGILNIHRNEEYWPNPLKFDPDRFSPEENAKRHPYAFLPFSGGPRNCIGIEYGMMTMKTVMATVLRRYILKKNCIVPAKNIRLSYEIIMKTVEPITVRIERRMKN